MPTVLLAIVQLLRFCTSPDDVARRQDGDLAKIDLAATEKHLGTLAVAAVDLAAPPTSPSTPGRPAVGPRGYPPNTLAVADLAGPPPRRRRPPRSPR